MIIRRAQQRARQVWIPRETVAFLLVTSETQIRATLSRRVFGKKIDTHAQSIFLRAGLLCKKNKCKKKYFSIIQELDSLITVPGLEGCLV